MVQTIDHPKERNIVAPNVTNRNTSRGETPDSVTVMKIEVGMKRRR
jgi:hypothetical protein